MKHIASIVQDGVAHYALVDEETGEMTQFAQLLVPEHFDLTGSALLGSNLVNVLGLNGKQRYRKTAPKALSAQQGSLLDDEEPLAIAPPPKEKQAPAKPAAKRANVAKRYITPEEVLEIIHQYPEGIMVRHIADRLSRQDGNGEVAAAWYMTAIMNRLTQLDTAVERDGTPPRYRKDKRPRVLSDGSVSATGQTSMWLLPPEDAS